MFNSAVEKTPLSTGTIQEYWNQEKESRRNIVRDVREAVSQDIPINMHDISDTQYASLLNNLAFFIYYYLTFSVIPQHRHNIHYSHWSEGVD